MSQATGYFLRLPEHRLSLLREELSLSGRFAEAVTAFGHPRKSALVTFVISADGNGLYLAKGRRGISAATGQSRLNLDEIELLDPPLPLSALAAQTGPRFRRALANALELGGLLTAKQFHALVEAILGDRPALATLLSRYSASYRERIEAISPRARDQLATEKEAIGTALNIGGFDKKELLEWDPPALGNPPSFLSGLSQVRLRESQVIANDLANFPGFSFIQQNITGTAVFESDNARMSVTIADKLPLEQLTGTDLIYYNTRFHCFVMVQYKMMESRVSTSPVFRLPSEQLALEIERMRTLLLNISRAATGSEPSSFRFSNNPFFLKFCPRLVFQPEDSGLSKGMYIPLDHYSMLTASDELVQDSGGAGITFRNVGRYLDNTSFANLVAGGWIGTAGTQSQLIADAIRTTLESGRAAIIAVHTPELPLPEGGDDIDLSADSGPRSAEDDGLPF